MVLRQAGEQDGIGLTQLDELGYLYLRKFTGIGEWRKHFPVHEVAGASLGDDARAIGRARRRARRDQGVKQIVFRPAEEPRVPPGLIAPAALLEDFVPLWVDLEYGVAPVLVPMHEIVRGSEPDPLHEASLRPIYTGVQHVPAPLVTD